MRELPFTYFGPQIQELYRGEFLLLLQQGLNLTLLPLERMAEPVSSIRAYVGVNPDAQFAIERFLQRVNNKPKNLWTIDERIVIPQVVNGVVDAVQRLQHSGRSLQAYLHASGRGMPLYIEQR